MSRRCPVCDGAMPPWNVRRFLRLLRAGPIVLNDDHTDTECFTRWSRRTTP